MLIAVILLAAFGGIAYVVPSKFQRRVGQLRLNARTHGLFVSSQTIADLDAEPEDKVTSGGKKRVRTYLCVEYSYSFARPIDSAPCWQLVRYKKSELPIPGWLIKDNALVGVQLSDTNYWTDVAATIADMPVLCRSVSVGTHTVSWIGTEGKSAVLEDRFLDQLEASLLNLSKLSAEKAALTDTPEDSK